PVRVQPMLSITPKALDAIDVVASLGATTFLTHDDVITAHRQRGVSLPAVGVVQAARPRMHAYQADYALTTARFDREDLHLAVTLDDAEHDHLAGGTP